VMVPSKIPAPVSTAGCVVVVEEGTVVDVVVESSDLLVQETSSRPSTIAHATLVLITIGQM
jgi:hypothetical protein